ncbi:SRPBCC family protein [Nonomuraea sp. NEAU-A123]|uniref:SRPBCC family protein n=1 Tax=Nonomuraea sp. NEAU-A123 TaxID=2839649 RepID=UPI001BE450E0|nr:SRPBCC family protein [Nonomuraea sp. NEAU-A123]MBT2231906.1 SRPBCC family protein [Nonomuraea sp. NEAU-A123]
MRLVNTFDVPAPLAAAWPVMTDIERLVSCVPGAALDSHEGDAYRGHVSVRVGPVNLRFAGTAEVTSVDPGTHTLAIRASARDHRGQGGLTAVVTVTLAAAAGERTTVDVRTDVDLTGKVAQYGAGMIEKVSGRIVRQFAARLEQQFAGAMTGARSPAPQQFSAGHDRPASNLFKVLAPVAGAALGAFLLGFACRRALDQQTIRPHAARN